MIQAIAALMPLLELLFFVLHITPGGSFPKPLSAKRERECLERIRCGDAAARHELIEHNLRLVVHIVKKYYSSIKDQDDLISIGTIGLIKAVSTFDYEKGTRFATYASRCIENAIHTLRLCSGMEREIRRPYLIGGGFGVRWMTVCGSWHGRLSRESAWLLCSFEDSDCRSRVGRPRRWHF